MIKSITVAAVFGQADQLADRNYRLAPVENTILAEMVRATPTDAIQQQTGNIPLADHVLLDPTALSRTIQELSQGSLEQPSLHDQCADGYINDLATVVRGHISFAKNVVMPVIKQYADNVATALDSMTQLNPANGFNIDVQELPEPLQDASFVETLARYQGKRPISPTNPLRCLDAKTPDALLALMQIGEHELDQRIAAWFHRRGETFFQYVWDYFFGMGSDPKATIYLRSALDVQPSLYLRGDIGLAVYLIANRLYYTNELLAAPLPLAQYQLKLAELRDYGATLARYTAERAESIEKQQLLVVSRQPETKQCAVVGPVYRTWLEAGGSPELLFGLLVSDRQVSAAAPLLAMKTELLQAWSEFSTFQTAVYKTQSFDRFKAVLEQEFNAAMGNLLEEEKAYEQQNGQYRTLVQRYLKEELASLRTPAMASIPVVARQLICRARFYYTNANALLQTMEDVTLTTPELPAREAALLAAVEYVASYIADQITIVAF